MNAPLEGIPATLTLADQIAKQVASKIINGVYAEGESIPEQSIAELFNVSRGPVREALRILEREGLVTIVPRKGARVTSLSKEEVAELFEIRSVLFGLAGRLCAERFDRAKYEQLSELFKPVKAFRPSATKDASEYAELSAELANALVRLAGNQRLRSMIDPVVLQVQRYSMLGLSSVARQRESIASWTELMAVLPTGDGDAAERIAKQMVQRTGDFAAARLSALHETVEPPAKAR